MRNCIKLSFTCSRDAAALASDFLLGAEAFGVAVDETDDEGIKSVSAYFATESDANSAINGLSSYLCFLRETMDGLYVSPMKIESIERDAWEKWMLELKTVRAGRRIVVVPPWESYEPRADDVVVNINPSMAFGTGHHESTRLAISFIEEIAEKKEIGSMLDLGCGSGILSIVAVKLGIMDVTAVDIDPVAVEEASQNACANGVGGRIRLITGTIGDVVGTFDLIVANLSPRAILEEGSLVIKALAPGGVFIASGIPSSCGEEVELGLKDLGFELISRCTEGDWVSFLLGLSENQTRTGAANEFF
jgi:ribosomal protein L11 methyltransferase